METKRFLLLHVGFTPPTPDIMEAWRAWFASIEDRQVDRGGFAGGREITPEGTRDLAWDLEALTGYNVIEAESLDEAEAVARTNPFISAIRVYEIRDARP